MKKLLIITIISFLISLPITSIPSTCMAVSKVTPYEPEVKYNKPQAVSKEPAEIKPSPKKKTWLWVVGGVVIAGAAAALAGGGGGGNGGGGTTPPGEDVDVDITW